MKYIVRLFYLLKFSVKTVCREYRKNNWVSNYLIDNSKYLAVLSYVFFENEKPTWRNFCDMICYAFKVRYYRIKRILFKHQTTNVRFFYRLFCLGMMLFYGVSDLPLNPNSEYELLTSKI